MPVPLGRVGGTRTGIPLPDPFPGLAKSKFKVGFGRGQLGMLAGPPGAGKTTVALLMALRMGVPALYFSADSDDTTMAARTASALTHHPYSDVRKTQAYGLFSAEYGHVLKDVPVRFVFDPSEPSVPDIWDGVAAYMDVFGEAPHLLIVDNLMNCKTDDQNEWQALRAIVKELHFVARKSKAFVMVLHHTSEQNDQHITKAPPRTAIQGKLSQLPEVILTVANDQTQNVLWVAVVKNRHGASDPLAKEPLRWQVDFSTNRVWDEPMMTGGRGGTA